MRRRHLPAVMRIERQSNPKPWSVGVFTGELAQGAERYYVVAKYDRRVCGYAGLMFVADEAHITNIAVGPEVRRQGVGARLLATLVRESLRRHCGSMTLEVRMGNRPAQELYRKFGFESVGTRPRYYSETGEDALIMWLYNLGSPEVRARLGHLGGAG
jgi:ribosomal-protein-alanine N-acetyltransferase